MRTFETENHNCLDLNGSNKAIYLTQNSSQQIRFKVRRKQEIQANFMKTT